jgi:hypothetical protein
MDHGNRRDRWIGVKARLSKHDVKKKAKNSDGPLEPEGPEGPED